MPSRRNFIQQGSLAFIGSLLLPSLGKGNAAEGMIMTVNGPLRPSELKFTLTHEHVLVDFIGAEKWSRDRYNADEVFNVALPFLVDLKKSGCSTFADCTPAYLGRDALLLHRLSIASRLNIITNTGYYGAAGEKFLPEHAYSESAEQISERWVNEWRFGIDGTGIKPGFIKTGVDKAPLTATQQKIVHAAALTHLATGLTIAIHTGNGDAAVQHLEILNAKGVSPSALIWVHAQNETDSTYHINAAKSGCWVSFDGLNANTIKANINYLKTMKNAGLLGSVLLSQDSGWYHAGEPNGGNYKNYNFIFERFIPVMKQNGFTRKEIDTIFIQNPAKAMSVKVRRL